MADVPQLADRLRKTAALGHVEPAALGTLVADVFAHCGVPRADAETAAAVAVWAQLHGSDSHGVVHLPLYTRGLLDKTIKASPKFEIAQPLPCCAVMDADHGLGLVASQRAVDLAIGLAKRQGLGAVAIRRSSHFGAAGYYADCAAKHGLIGLAFSNAMPAIAPTGGTEGLLGTNPIGAAFPVPNADPIIADMATAMVARSRIRHALAAGQTSIPEGWALDPSGKPTTDPAVAVKGSLLPIGGPKGYALSLLVEILCSALSDGDPGFQVTYENMVKRPSNICQFFLVLNPEGFAGAARYGARVSHIADVIGKAKPMQGASPPRLPGARGHAVKHKAEAEGIALFDNLRAALKTVAGMLEAHQEA
ncbi:MAG TPA: Ldh family oxidoreductase [Pseudolabrys sp.]|nr:Ldh family oxidoreductase [Pseudolabrys sp.]